MSGTFALCSAQLGKELDMPFFSIMSTIVSVCVVLLWALVAAKTTIEGWKGEIFNAPCLANVGDKIPYIQDPPRAKVELEIGENAAAQPVEMCLGAFKFNFSS
jgi:hypothetical protein